MIYSFSLRTQLIASLSVTSYYCIFALLVGSCAITSKVHILRL